MTTNAHQIRCTFLALRGVDLLFSRTVLLTDVPRIGERVHIWFEAAATVRGIVRDVRWTIPDDGVAAVTLQVHLSPLDHERFARRPPMPPPPSAREPT